MSAPTLSIVVPLYREQATIPELVRRVLAAVAPVQADFELVLVDDGSDDGQWEAIRAEAAREPRVRGVRLARNFGLQAAATAALAEARGRAVVLMDGDLQDPPELIPSLLAKWREGFEVVLTVKDSRPERWALRLAFAGFHRLFGLVSEVPVTLHSGLFSLLDRKAVDALLTLPERVRYLPGLRAWVGHRTATVHYAREKRFAGRPQGVRRLIAMAVDALLSFTTLPLRLIVWLGLFLVMASVLGMAAIVWIRLRWPDVIVGWASQLTTTIFMGAIQLVFLGVLAEYLGRIYTEVKARPIFLVSERTPQPLESNGAGPALNSMSTAERCDTNPSRG